MHRCKPFVGVYCPTLGNYANSCKPARKVAMRGLKGAGGYRGGGSGFGTGFAMGKHGTGFA